LVGTITAFLTAVYAFRAYFVPFWGTERVKALWEHAHESPRIMTIPLVILAIGAVLVGFIGIPFAMWIEPWLEPVFAAAHEIKHAEEATGGNMTKIVLLVIAAIVALSGAFVAYRAFLVNMNWPKRVRESLGGFGTLVENKYRVDELYNAAVVAPLLGLARWFAGPVDQRTIDGAVNGIAGLTGSLGERVRRLQVGQVGIYALSMLFGAVAILIWLAVQ